MYKIDVWLKNYVQNYCLSVESTITQWNTGIIFFQKQKCEDISTMILHKTLQNTLKLYNKNRNFPTL
jgi:hypothetical protein